MMAATNENNYIRDFITLSPSTVYETLQPLTNFSDWSSDSTTRGTNPSAGSSLSSPPQSLTDINSEFIFAPENIFDNNRFDLFASNTHPLFTTPDTPSIEILINEFQKDQLQIIAQPKQIHRLRYDSEVDLDKNRAQRYIRTGNTEKKYEYPTIKIPPAWCQQDLKLYVQVTLVTALSDRVPYHFIHPYKIDGHDQGIIKDLPNNTVYFRIHENELTTGEKSFNIIVKKKKQDDLKLDGPMRVYNSEQQNNLNFGNLRDGKQIISFFELYKTQFIFNLAQRHDNTSLPVPILFTSVESDIMIEQRKDEQNSSLNHSNDAPITRIKCVPPKGAWQGGDEVVLIMPSAINKKVYNISFQFGPDEHQVITEITTIDKRTLLFRTPACPLPQSTNNFRAFINIHEKDRCIQQIEYIYSTSSIITNYFCPLCQQMTSDLPQTNKRPRQLDFDFFKYDSGDALVSQMSQLSLEKTTIESRPSASSSTSTKENYTKFDKYLKQLKGALEVFVRTNDPSRLFRRTRALLSTSDEETSPLNDAIERGHTQVAFALIEQLIDMSPQSRLLEQANDNGETPLLIAAKVNQWKLVEVILKNRPDLAAQNDNDGNNFLHILASLGEDKGGETIENVFAIAPNEMKLNLLKGKNRSEQTPIEVAQSNNNNSCLKLLNDIKDTDK